MKPKYKFYEPGCYCCSHLERRGTGIAETRYCNNFPRDRVKRFRSSDPQIKAPSGCPRRISPPALRVYGFLDEFGRTMELNRLPAPGSPTPEYLHPQRSHYKLRLETQIAMTARQFYLEVKRRRGLDDFVENIEIGEVVEIDNGLKPYAFVYLGGGSLVMAVMFSRTGIEDSNT